MNNIFEQSVAETVIARINKLTPGTRPVWGKMSAGQMLAHCNVTYELVYEPEKHPAPKGVMKFILKAFVKNLVVSEKPYRRNSQTAPAFLVHDERNFENERQRLSAYIRKTQQLGQASFNGKSSHSFGNLTGTEWNNMFYKHLDHHLTQFGV